jgi:hypothetical protein
LYSITVVLELKIDVNWARRNKGDFWDTSDPVILALVGAPVTSGERGDVASIAPGIPGKWRDAQVYQQQHLHPQSF